MLQAIRTLVLDHWKIDWRMISHTIYVHDKKKLN